jgi:hypothetical protein
MTDAGWSRMDEKDWPTPFAALDTKENDVLKAKLEVRMKRAEQEIDEQKARKETDEVLERYVDQARVDLAKASVDRSRQTAEWIEKVAAGLLTVYSGFLAVSFSISERPLPTRALVAPILLGGAVAMAAGYLAYRPDKEPEYNPPSHRLARSRRAQLLSRFQRWIALEAGERVWSLRASVLLLGLALAFFPAPWLGWERSYSPVEWPTLADNAPSELELKEILYQAQVDQAVSVSGGTLQDSGGDSYWFIAAVGLGVAAIAWARQDKGIGEQEASDGAGGDA